MPQTIKDRKALHDFLVKQNQLETQVKIPRTMPNKVGHDFNKQQPKKRYSVLKIAFIVPVMASVILGFIY